MAIKSFYGEELYFSDGSIMLSDELEVNIRKLLALNHGVGIVGGKYEMGLPIHLISKLALNMLGCESLSDAEECFGGMFLPMFCSESDEPMTEESFAAMPEASEKCLNTKDNRTLWVRIVKRDEVRETGERTWLVSVCDIDAVHRHEQQLLSAKEEADRANLAKTFFLSRMSHDMRTPMNGILGMAHIALENREDPAIVGDALNKIIDVSKRLNTLIDEVLDMSRLESGRNEPENEPFNLREELEAIEGMILSVADEHGVNLCDMRFGEKHDCVIGSIMHIRRVIENLLTNAVKYTPAGGFVKCTVDEIPIDENHSTYRFTISDTGVGMSEEFQKHMFEPFSREQNPKIKIPNYGTGLGLSIAKELVEMMGGTIEAKSKIGEGTVFVVSIPLELGKQLPQTTESREKLVRDLGGMNIMLVEDNNLNREIAEYVLTHAGAKIDSAENGKIATEKFISSPDGTYDLILMDIMMPEMDGLEATRAIRASKHPQAKTVPIVAMTANAFSDDIRKSREAGMNEHLTKPLEFEKVIAALDRYHKRKISTGENKYESNRDS